MDTEELLAEEIQISNPDRLAQRRFNALIIAGIVLPFLLYPFLSQVFIHQHQSFLIRLWLSRGLIWGVTATMLVYAKKAEVQPFLLWKEQKHQWSFYLLSFIALYFLAIVAGIISAIPGSLGLPDNKAVMLQLLKVLQANPVLLVFTAFTAGVTEELIFRGYILSRLQLFFKGKAWPVLISSALFGSIHITYYSVGEVFYAIMIGLICGFHYQKYRNLKVLMFTHFMIDLIATSVKRH